MVQRQQKPGGGLDAAPRQDDGKHTVTVMGARARPHGRRWRSDGGSVSVLAVILTVVVVMFFGAVVDFEQKLEVRQDANAAAQEAARAGAGRVDLDRAYARGEFVMDGQSAIQAARAYLRSGRYTGTVTASGTHAIRVRVSIDRPSLFLQVIGIASLHADATATANLTTGVRGARQP
ncbi:pilus assembly protein TadG-related protein [Actinomadura chibensis]|nr:pilus assembly protein TadG-related protein [Actinomadura chibensis]